MTIIMVPYCCDDHVGPKLGSIFAQSPAFILKAPLLPGDVQVPLWLTRPHIPFGIENREVFPNNVRFLIAFYAFCTSIPGRNVAFGIEHENTVIQYSFNHQPELI